MFVYSPLDKNTQNKSAITRKKIKQSFHYYYWKKSGFSTLRYSYFKMSILIHMTAVFHNKEMVSGQTYTIFSDIAK